MRRFNSPATNKAKGPHVYGKLIKNDKNFFYRAINYGYTYLIWGYNGLKHGMWFVSVNAMFFMVPMVVESLFEQQKILMKITMS